MPGCAGGRAGGQRVPLPRPDATPPLAVRRKQLRSLLAGMPRLFPALMILSSCAFRRQKKSILWFQSHQQLPLAVTNVRIVP